MKKLISMVEYALIEQKNCIPVKIHETINNVFNYANFLSQTITLGMFIPVSESGNILQMPTGADEDYANYYAKAKERCLFQGFELSEDGLCVFTEQESSEFHLSLDEIENEGYTIECLVGESLILTGNALKQK